jgi:hypothetical protein
MRMAQWAVMVEMSGFGGVGTGRQRSGGIELRWQGRYQCWMRVDGDEKD